MKYFFLIFVYLMLTFNLFADNVRNFMEKVKFSSLPFECVKEIDYPKPAWGFPYDIKAPFSLEIYTDLGLTQKKFDSNINYSLFRKFRLCDERYALVVVDMDIAESAKKVLLTYRDGEFIDYIESEVSWWSGGAFFVKQWRITSDEEIIVTWLKVQSKTPINAFSDFSSVNAQRIDMHYRIDEHGKFQLIKEVKYKLQNYTKAYLADKTKNLWEGNEIPLLE